MGTLCRDTPHLVQDLRVTVQKVTLVFPSQETERKSLFLSNIDKVLNFHVETVHFFPSHKDFPPHVVADKLKNTLAKILVPCDFLAGRLSSNPETGRLEINCNAAGAVFAVASSEYTLHDVGDLVYPNPAFGQLIYKITDHNSSPEDDRPLCTVQLTSFKCGGFALGLSTNHATFDGLSFKNFLENLAAIAADKPLAVTPFNDRKLLAARSPPRINFPHHELAKLEDLPKPPVFGATPEALDFNIFRLSSADVSALKDKAKSSSNARVSGFNVVTALVWRCKALSSSETNENPNRVSTLLYAVDIRPRLSPPLPRSYAGNAVLTAYARATCNEIEEGPFWKLVEMVAEGAKRMTDEYARSAIDWGEINQGFPHGEFLVSSWWKLGFDKVEYPWGRPRYSCPVVYHRKDIILLFPADNNSDENGVNILVALPAKEMEKFRSLFYEFMA